MSIITRGFFSRLSRSDPLKRVDCSTDAEDEAASKSEARLIKTYYPYPSREARDYSYKKVSDVRIRMCEGADLHVLARAWGQSAVLLSQNDIVRMLQFCMVDLVEHLQ